MFVRWLPASMILFWIALVRVRIVMQERRYGGKHVHFDRKGDVRQRLRDRAAGVGLLILFATAVLAGLERVELASTELQRTIGIALGFGGALAMFSAQLGLGASWRIGIDPNARTPLVTGGWYAFCRNPIYLCVFIHLVGFALLVPNVVTWVIVGCMILGIRVQTLREERWLRETYAAEWREYAARVGRFVPFIGRLARE